MTQFRKKKYGTPRTRQTYWIDDPLIPVIRKIADDRQGLSQADIVNTALHQLSEVKDGLKQRDKTHEDDNSIIT